MVNEEILTKLVADKSGLNRKEVEAQLDELIQSVKTGAKEGESVKIEGFGTFKPQKKATLFEPNEILQTEINQKYAGMKPIELMGSFKDSDAAVPAGTTSGEIAKQPQIGKEEGPSQESKSEEYIPPKPTESTPKNRPETETQKEEPSSKEPIPAKAENKTNATTDGNSGPMGMIIVIIAIIAALVLAGWLFYSIGAFSSSEPTAQRTVQSTTHSSNTPNKEQANIGQLTAGPNIIKTSANGTDVLQENSNKKLVGKKKNISTYGLRGTVQAKAKDGYTIIVHSLVRKKHAFKTLRSIKQQEYRTLMLMTQVNGKKYWRIGIGQFKTIADAQKAAKTLPEPFKNNHFIKHQ